jgi:hypothetical protein
MQIRLFSAAIRPVATAAATAGGLLLGSLSGASAQVNYGIYRSNEDFQCTLGDHRGSRWRAVVHRAIYQQRRADRYGR